MCEIKKCGCNTPNSPIICMSYEENPNCEDRSLTVSNTTDPLGYSGVTMITPEVNQISAYKEHLEFVNSPEPLSGIKKHTVLRIAQSFIDGITGLISNFVGKNLGTGAEIYKGPKIEGENVIQEFRTLKNSESVEFQEGTDDIIAVVNEEWLQQQFPAIPTINYPVIDGKSSSDYGVPIYDGLDSDKKIKILPVSSGQINIQKKTTPEGQDYLDFDIPVSTDETVKSFYVNENNTKPNPNGSILKPYHKLTQALKEIIGTGTVINPQYKKAKIILQSNVTVSLADLVAQPLLEGRISVNTTSIMSEDNYTITYQGLVDYPISTAFLETKAIASTYIGEVYLTFYNVTVYSETVKGIVELKTFENANSVSSHNLNNFTVKGTYSPNLYTSFTPPVTLFGVDVKGQTTAISNDTPTVYLHGFNNQGLGNYNITGSFFIVGSSQTYLKIENTAVNMESVRVEHNPYYLSVNNMTDKAPKAGLHRVEIINSWVNIKNDIKSDEEMSGVGGTDSFIRYFSDGSYPGANLIVNGGYIYNARFNKILSINNSATNTILLQNCDFNKATALVTAFSNENGNSPVKLVNVNNSYISNVDLSTVCGIEVGATFGYVNGSQFTSMAFFPNNNAALEAGLIPGNLYINATNQIIRVHP